MRNIIEDNWEGINGIKWEHSWEYKASGEMPIKQYKGMVHLSMVIHGHRVQPFFGYRDM